jgi:hypothetical protein
MTLAQWHTRAIELANAHDLLHSARLMTPLGSGAALQAARELVYAVPSSDGRGEHMVRVQSDGRTSCNCTAGSWGYACRHAGSAIAHVRLLVRVYSGRGRQETRDHQEFCRWLETRGY